MKDIQSRIRHCKNRVPINSPKTEESKKIAQDVADFLANSGKITRCYFGQANFKDDLTKGNDNRNSKRCAITGRMLKND